MNVDLVVHFQSFSAHECVAPAEIFGAAVHIPDIVDGFTIQYNPDDFDEEMDNLYNESMYQTVHGLKPQFDESAYSIRLPYFADAFDDMVHRLYKGAAAEDHHHRRIRIGVVNQMHVNYLRRNIRPDRYDLILLDPPYRSRLNLSYTRPAYVFGHESFSHDALKVEPTIGGCHYTCSVELVYDLARHLNRVRALEMTDRLLNLERRIAMLERNTY